MHNISTPGPAKNRGGNPTLTAPTKVAQIAVVSANALQIPAPKNLGKIEVRVETQTPAQTEETIEFPGYFRTAIAVLDICTATRAGLKSLIKDTALPQTHISISHRNVAKAIELKPFLKLVDRASENLELVFEQGATPEPESLAIRSVAIHLQANLEVFSAHLRQISDDGRLPYGDRDRVCQSAIELKAAVAQMILRVEAIMSGADDVELEGQDEVAKPQEVQSEVAEA